MLPAGQINQVVISTFVQVVLHGLYLGSFVHCLRWLIYDDEGWRLRVNINRSMLAITLLLFLLYAAEFGTSICTVLAFVSGDDLVVDALNPAAVCAK